MSTQSCTIQDCHNDVVFVFHRVDDRKTVYEAHYCSIHGENFIALYNESREQISGASLQTSSGRILIDIEVLTYDWRSEHYCKVSLREVGAPRKLDLDTGPCEISALGWALRHPRNDRPLTHRALSDIITRLGGRLRHVDIDIRHQHDDRRSARLYFNENDEALTNVRPSDAIILAVICDVPIYLSEHSY